MPYSMFRFLKNLVHTFLAWCSALIFRFPGRSMTVIGITGTDGKTTTTHCIYHILQSCGKKVSMVSSVEAIIAGKRYDTGFHVTTPGAWSLQRFMRKARNAGSEYFVLEVTSHALDQGRVVGASVNIAVVTNISHEHLDYHGSLENYWGAKAKLLRGAATSILNLDDPNVEFLLKRAKKKVVTFSLEKEANVTTKTLDIHPKILGEFNIANCLAAATVGLQIGIDRECIETAITTFTGIPGRMEEVQTKKPFRAIIDFAHKPNALRNALLAARRLTDKKVIVVFGCAGLRDRLKRPMMGEIAAELADCIVLTAEDPRTEDVRNIIDQIAQGCLKKNAVEAKKSDTRLVEKIKKEKNKTYFWRIPDRQEAINFSLRKLASAGDVVMLLGKGHEQSMCWGKTEYPWDEKQAVRKALYDSV